MKTVCNSNGKPSRRVFPVVASLLFSLICGGSGAGTTYEIYPAIADSQEEFETLANALKPGDELILHGGVYSQSARRAVTVTGTETNPIIIRAAEDEEPLLTRPTDNIDRYNNIEFVSR